MVFTFPYHDPEGKYNEVFKKNFQTLKRTFSQIFISVTPLTYIKNRVFIDLLSAEGFIVYENKTDSHIGDHFRNALLLSQKNVRNDEKIFFSFIDRVLYILESQRAKDFLNDLNFAENGKLIIYERSAKAWFTHPGNYRTIEKFANIQLKLLSGVDIEMNFCAIVLAKDAAEKILNDSQANGWEIPGEWMLLALMNSIQLATKKVDWLSWEDPFWEKVHAIVLKKEREQSQEETIKRIKTNLPFLELLVEDRFKKIYKSSS